ncbi:hypothetical protein [Halobacillus sp. A5]|uniref:hypothetical protein n=1 Tax=Halobacillus sp. A5 TaxID=2880263 RepID=UPI0020A64992|nr:hypothetical protein [Halobacillus sp. A5]MCP3025404.1 hypothetical protein [Halobacillus sp. A5]
MNNIGYFELLEKIAEQMEQTNQTLKEMNDSGAFRLDKHKTVCECGGIIGRGTESINPHSGRVLEKHPPRCSNCLKEYPGKGDE